MRQAQVVTHLVGKGGRHPDGVIVMILEQKANQPRVQHVPYESDARLSTIQWGTSTDGAWL